MRVRAQARCGGRGHGRGGSVGICVCVCKKLTANVLQIGVAILHKGMQLWLCFLSTTENKPDILEVPLCNLF